METPHVSVVVPVFNNQSTLAELADRATAVLRKCCGRRHELIFVDDGSTDISWTRINEQAEHFTEVTGLHLSRNFGQHAAILAGLSYASGDVTCIMDADLEHQPEDLPTLLSPLGSGAALVVAVDAGAARRRSSDIFQRIFGRLAKAPIHPRALTYRVMNRSFKQALLQYDEVDLVLGPVMSSMGFNQVYVPVQRLKPLGRNTSYSPMQRLGLAAKALLIHATFVPALLGWLVTIMALGLLGYAFVVITQTLVFGSKLPEGLTLLLLVVLASTTTILAALGFLTYIGLGILREVKKRPRFHIDQITRPIVHD